jgi:hypothetical protein
MGLTIHYDIKSTTKSETRARELVESMRQFALDLPFDYVGDIVEIHGDACNPENYGRDDDLRYAAQSACVSVRLPWNRKISTYVNAKSIFYFLVNPGPGCESLELGLAAFPAEIEFKYQPSDDSRFQTAGQFSYAKFNRWRNQQGKSGLSLYDTVETRKIPIRRPGWTASGFCKTQYASEPACGGVPNFLRCHIAAITLLERIATLKTVSVSINDEGHYGPARYSDDWREAYAAKVDPTYVWHEPTHSVPELVEQCGEYNELIATWGGMLKDAGASIAMPIADYSNFEQLEFAGISDAKLSPFLDTMRQLAKTLATITE